MKKFLAILLCALLLLTFVACNDEVDEEDKTLVIATDNEFTNNDGLGYFTYDINKDGHYSITGYNTFSSEKHEIVIPAEIADIKVTGIATEAFKACTNLTAITIPSSVTFIDDLAFYGCSSLTTITVPDSVVEIGVGAFRDCTGLESIALSANITELSSQLFWGCEALSEVTIPTNVTKIGEAAFWGCTAISEVNVPASVTEIEKTAFYGCSALAKVDVPASVTAIGEAAFVGLNNGGVEFTTDAEAAFVTYFENNFGGDNVVDYPNYKLITK